jgi:hypothetical protein
MNGRDGEEPRGRERQGGRLPAWEPDADASSPSPSTPPPVPATPRRPGTGPRRARRDRDSGDARAAVRYVRFGDALAGGLATWFRNVVPVTVLAVLAYVPVILVFWLVRDSNRGLVDEWLYEYKRYMRWMYLFMSLKAVGFPATGLLLSGVAAFLVHEQVRYRRAGPLRVLGHGVRRFLPTVWALFLVMLLMSLCVFVMLLFVGLFTGGEPGPVGYVVFLVLLIPIGMLASCVVLTTACAVVERTGRPIRRSFDLTHGNRAPIFGLIAMWFIVEWLLWAIIAAISGRPDDPGQGAVLIAMTVSFVLAGPRAATTAVVYDRIIQGREGVAVERLEAVFE